MNSPILHGFPNKHHCIPFDVFNLNICTSNAHQSN
jgi:hypothetical protein